LEFPELLVIEFPELLELLVEVSVTVFMGALQGIGHGTAELMNEADSMARPARPF
jgi:hypothetical protein